VKHGNGGFLAVTLETGELAIDYVPVLHVLTISTVIDLPEGPLSKETLRLLAYLNKESMGPRYYVDYCWDKPIAVVSLEVRTYPVLVMDHMLEGLKQVAREIKFHGCQYHSTRHLRP
jgi:hypothetical protein